MENETSKINARKCREYKDHVTGENGRRYARCLDLL